MIDAAIFLDKYHETLKIIHVAHSYKILFVALLTLSLMGIRSVLCSKEKERKKKTERERP